MYAVDFTKKSKVHFTGIGGISMSGLAEILLSKGFEVTGSDSKRSEVTDHLEGLGAVVYLGQREANVDETVDFLVYTAAVKDDNPELVKARSLNIPILSRAQFLGQIMKNYKTAIGVSGTHGKTSTTSMLSEIFVGSEMDPTILVGGMLPSIGGNSRIGHSDKFITEACEYTNSFLEFAPTVGIILNVREDHLDFFKDIDDIRNSFKKYANLLPDDGTLVICSDIDDISYFTEGLKCNIITFGSDPAKSNYSFKDANFDEMARGSYTLLIDGKESGSVKLNVTGEHNITNSLAAIAASVACGISVEDAIKGLSLYKGVDRRFQYKGNIGNIAVVDDYAHHPDEIEATLKAAEKYPHNKLWVVFQPHTYTRTKALFNEFANVLSKAENIVLCDIYAAREKDTLGIGSKDLLSEIKKKNEDISNNTKLIFEFYEITDDTNKKEPKKNKYRKTILSYQFNKSKNDLNPDYLNLMYALDRKSVV